MTHILKKTIIATCLFLATAVSAHAADNPMGYIGERHNESLGCVLKHTPGPLWPFGLGDECGFKEALSAKEMQERYGPLVASLAGSNQKQRAQALQPYLSQLSKVERSYWNKAENALKAARSPEMAQKQLIQIEQDAVARLDPESKGGMAVLAAISTMRSSIGFWTAPTMARTLVSGGGKNNMSHRLWWHGPLADACGGLVGAILAGPPGAIALGVASSAAVARS